MTNVYTTTKYSLPTMFTAKWGLKYHFLSRNQINYNVSKPKLLTFITDLKIEFIWFTVDSIERDVESLVRLNSTNFVPTSAIKLEDIHWPGIMVFDINNSFESYDFGSIFHNNF